MFKYSYLLTITQSQSIENKRFNISLYFLLQLINPPNGKEH